MQVDIYFDRFNKISHLGFVQWPVISTAGKIDSGLVKLAIWLKIGRGKLPTRWIGEQNNYKR